MLEVPYVNLKRFSLPLVTASPSASLIGAGSLSDADTPAVHDRRRSLRIPALLLPGGPAQSYEDVLPEAVQTPSPEPVVDGTPRRKGVGR